MRALMATSFFCLLSLACSSTSTGTAGNNGSGTDNTPTTIGKQCDAIGAAYCKHVVTDCSLNGAASGATVGDQCTELANALCPRSIACGTDTSASTCNTSFMASCCGNNGTCSTAAASAAGPVDSCATALSQIPCTDLTSRNFPAVCTSVITPVGATTIESCTTEGHQACCGSSSNCDKVAQSESSSIDACVQAIDSQACSSGAALPVACKGVVKSSSVAVRLESAGLHGAALAPRVVGERGIGAAFASE